MALRKYEISRFHRGAVFEIRRSVTLHSARATSQNGEGLDVQVLRPVVKPQRSTCEVKYGGNFKRPPDGQYYCAVLETA